MNVHLRTGTSDVLQRQFTPTVKKAIQPIVENINHDRRQSIHFEDGDLVSANYDVVFDGVNEFAAYYRLTVELKGIWHSDDLRVVENALADSSSYEDPALFVIDLYATEFRDGKFSIWVRGWPPR